MSGVRAVRLTVDRWADRLRRRPEPAEPIARVAVNMRPAGTAWGGGSQWVAQMVRYLADRRYAVGFELRDDVDGIVMVDPRRGGLVTFGPDDIAHHRARRPEAFCLHRVNENDARKGTDDVDGLLAAANRVADETVFVSRWLRDYHAARWFDTRRPHAVIGNAADPRIFHPLGSVRFAGDGPLRLVTHHWSDNWRKGFKVYQELDALIAGGALPDTELWVIGRWPQELRWKAARTFEPTHGEALAALLRQCHAYVTASLWEPGGMHFVEGAQCGLPLLYHEDGGGTPEVGERFGVAFRDDVRGAVLTLRRRYDELRDAVLGRAPSGDAMCQAYAQVIQRGIALAREARRGA
jgi:glycosyltransferase involved in cell wall biosynthesis